MTNQNINDIINQENHINTSQIQDCLRIVNHFLYFSSFQLAVIILNHHQRRIIKAINDSNHRIKLTIFCTQVNNPQVHVSTQDPGTSGFISGFTTYPPLELALAIQTFNHNKLTQTTVHNNNFLSILFLL